MSNEHEEKERRPCQEATNGRGRSEKETDYGSLRTFFLGLGFGMILMPVLGLLLRLLLVGVPLLADYTGFPVPVVFALLLCIPLGIFFLKFSRPLGKYLAGWYERNFLPPREDFEDDYLSSNDPF